MFTSGLLIVGHGTREARGVTDFLGLVELVRPRMPDWPVEPAFLEFAQPSIEEGLEQLVKQGVGEVVVVPLLLFAAGHVRRDIPAAVAQAAARHSHVHIRQVSPLGCHPRIVQLSTQRYHEALNGQGKVPPQESLLLLVGRGSHDPRASREMLRFTELRRKTARGGWVETCFTAMERPLLGDTLPRIAKQPVRQVVVQPHLLFSGHLTAQIGEAVAQARASWPTIHWVVTEPLGLDPLLAEAVVAIATGVSEPPVLGWRRAD